ncbi:Scr1 family TA system antitoxin-like transcriptional regulator [Nocardia cyriacigeorgica]|uniref:Scr1 family TA system antitoxin-like transcriptional regulator n=1 Tax=Nocardia cyriacigeorgica TaxID=135487 RepID=UPI002B4B2199|nr:Scr1 family TA system antitoxin-like transcriptional regulator [Nocardia cyriacigeorgica]
MAARPAVGGTGTTVQRALTPPGPSMGNRPASPSRFGAAGQPAAAGAEFVGEVFVADGEFGEAFPGVVDQPGRGGALLYRQLRHLAEMIRRHPDNVDVRVIPFTSPASVMGGSTFHLLDFDSPRLPTSAWHESAAFGELFTDDAERKETRVRDLA